MLHHESTRARRRADRFASRHTPRHAASIIGLVDGKTLVWVDPATKKVTGKADIKGAAMSSASTCVRPTACSTRVTADGGIYTVDAKTGQATMKSKISEA